ncbi:MAG: hypothetical protein WCA32_01860 [Chromatiaceae bacterium]
MKSVATAVVCLSVAFFAGCDGGDEGQQSAAPAGPSMQQPSGAPAEVGTGKALASINVCALMPDDVVAQLLEKRVTRGGTRRDYGIYTQGCEYELRAGDGRIGYEYVFIDLKPRGTFGGLDEALQTARTMGQHVTGERVSGLGVKAFAIDNQTEQSTTLHVLRRGGPAVEVKANSLDHAGKLAAAVLERLSKD